MAYELPFDKFKTKVKNTEMKKVLSKCKLPDPAFFAQPIWKTGKRVQINIEAKCSEANLSYLEDKLGIKRVGKELNYFLDGDTIRFIVSGKAVTTGKKKSRNALGKQLADAGELATVKSLTEEINTPKDTGQKIFKDDVDAFNDWLPTFKHTKGAVTNITGPLTQFDILHDATDTSEFKTVISSFCTKIGSAKDSWNPADIFIIKKSKKKKIIKELKSIVEKYEVSTGLINVFNDTIYKMYTDGLMYPISLKQLISDKPSVDYENIPGKSKASSYEIEIEGFICNLSETGNEIGKFNFTNNDTNKKIEMQNRCFPSGYGITQTEITSDGTPTGGRLGKVPTKIVDSITAEYNSERISTIAFFGNKTKPFSTFNDARIKEVYKWYEKVVAHSKVNNTNPINLAQFTSLVEKAKKNFSVAESLCQKIQGLKLQYFFIENEKNISDIMNKMINGAKKINPNSGFFIKIY